MQDTLYNTQKQLVDSVAGKIDAASFRQCYERRDSSVRFFVIVSANRPMAQVVASLLEGTHEPKTLQQLAADGTVAIIPAIGDHLEAFAAGPDANTLELRRFLEAHIDLEVRAFYCPPGYFVQFTGRRWE